MAQAVTPEIPPQNTAHVAEVAALLRPEVDFGFSPAAEPAANAAALQKALDGGQSS